MNIARSGTKVAVARISGTVVMFLGITVFARKLDADAMGIFFLFEALLGVLSIPADFGVRRAVEKRISEGPVSDRVLGSAITIKLAFLAVIVAAILLARGPINAYLSEAVAVFLAIGLVFREFALLMVSVLKGELRVGETASLQVTRHLIWVGASGVLILYGFGTMSLIYGALVGYVAMLLWGIVKVTTSVGMASMEMIRSLLNYGKSIFIASLGGQIYARADILIIGVFLGPVYVAAYEIAWRITGIFRTVTNSIGSAIFPQVSAWDAEDNNEQIEQLIPEAIAPSLMLVIPAFFGTVVLSDEILGIVFGSQYTIAWLVLIILMIDMIFQAVHVIVGSALQAINRPDLSARAAAISTVLNIVLNVLFIWKIGIIGAAIATVLASLVNDFLHYFYLSNLIKVRLPWRESLFFTAGSVLMALVLLTAVNRFPPAGILTLLVLVSFGALIYFVCLSFSRDFRTRVRNYVFEITT